MLPLFSVDIVGVVAVLQPDQEALLSPLPTRRRAWGGKKEQSAKMPNYCKDVKFPNETCSSRLPMFK